MANSTSESSTDSSNKLHQLASHRKRNSLLTNPAAADLQSRDEKDSLASRSTAADYGSINSTEPEFESLKNSTTSNYSSASRTSRTKWRKTSCLQKMCRRRPKGKAVFLIFVMYFLESFASHGSVSGIQQLILGGSQGSKWSSFVFGVSQFCLGRLFYPLAGVLADACLGRYNVIHIGLWLFWFGFAFLSISLSIVTLPHLSYVGHTFARYILPSCAAFLIFAGSGSIEATLIPFGVDQLSQGASSDELSSYFYGYYFFKNLGSVVGVGVYLAMFSSGLSTDYETQTLTSAQPIIAIVCITIALLIHICFKHWYFRDRARQNPLKSIIKVLYFSSTVKRQSPNYRRAFRMGEEKKPRIELAKVEYDGVFPSNEVEDVKTFCRIMLVIFSLGGYLSIYGAQYSMLSYQFKIVADSLNSSDSESHINTAIFELIDDGLVLFCLFFMNQIVLPFFPRFNMKMRVGVGVITMVLSSIAAACIQFSIHHHNPNGRIHILLLLLPAVLFIIAEILVFVTALEFIYAQSPESMKGLLTGLYYFIFGIFSLGGNVLYSQYPTECTDVLGTNLIAWFYVILSIIGIIAFAMYTTVACLYRNRERPTTDGSEGEAARRILAQKIFLRNSAKGTAK